MTNAFDTSGPSIFSKDHNFTGVNKKRSQTAQDAKPTLPPFILPNSSKYPAPELVKRSKK